MDPWHYKIEFEGFNLSDYSKCVNQTLLDGMSFEHNFNTTIETMYFRELQIFKILNERV